MIFFTEKEYLIGGLVDKYEYYYVNLIIIIILDNFLLKVNK